ncbi:cytochrome c [Pelagibius litoralis]|uniref:Cytochrome c n=1 Tax=Pelagibius litoralis TaxID=374515 RepID=A0A967F1S4_9PROT|nr:cytochrome c [Pelagibius litoralis]NIA71576.1 cytochrome c [Pelagibius litoralis]
MLRGLCILILAAGFMATQNQGLADDDPRTALPLPPEVGAGFLAEMRTHMANLDDIVAALAEDDFEEAARVADIRMTFGHHRWIRMAEDGASEEEIASAKTRFKQRHESRGGQRGGGMGMGSGFGRDMPEDFRAMGASLHEAAESFAQTARSVATPAMPGDYRAVFGALQEVTNSCRACHDAFRIEVSK